jgi:hypothetical protein
MSNCRRPTPISVAVLAIAVLSVAAVTAMLPNTLSVPTYAEEGNSNRARLSVAGKSIVIMTIVLNNFMLVQ